MARAPAVRQLAPPRPGDICEERLHGVHAGDAADVLDEQLVEAVVRLDGEDRSTPAAARIATESPMFAPTSTAATARIAGDSLRDSPKVVAIAR